MKCSVAGDPRPAPGSAGAPACCSAGVPPLSLTVRQQQVAVDIGVRTIAFPDISADIYGHPVDHAAEIAVETVMGFASCCVIDEMVFCYISERVLAINQKTAPQTW